jgi:hypothetical protein
MAKGPSPKNRGASWERPEGETAGRDRQLADADRQDRSRERAKGERPMAEERGRYAEAYCLECSWKLLGGDVGKVHAEAERHSQGSGHEVLGFDDEKEWAIGGSAASGPAQRQPASAGDRT